MKTLAIGMAVAVGLASAQSDEGKRQYQSLCVGCHGDDGSGGGQRPSFLDVRQPRATSRQAVRDLILKGIPNSGMPAFQLPENQADSIAAYVMTLKRPVGNAAAAGVSPPGDASAGERFFNGQGNCANCHMIR